MKAPPSKSTEKSPPQRARLTRGKAWAALLLISLIAYSGSFGLGLAQDSYAVIATDGRIRESTAANVKLIFTTDYWWPKAVDRLYRPVTTTSFLLNYAVLGNGVKAAGYHAVNFVLHSVAAGLVYELALLLLPGAFPALCAAALWAVHPIATESVTNIVGRADILAALSILGGLLLYIHGMRRQDGRRLALAGALFAVSLLGLLSKESAAVLIGIMLLWDLAFARDDLLRGFSRRGPFYAAAALPLAILLLVRQRIFASLPWPQAPFLDNILRGADFVTARLTALEVIGHYLWLLVWPVRLSIDRSYSQIGYAAWADPALWLSLAAIAAIVAFAVAALHRRALWFFLAGFFGITLLPTANLVLIIGSIMAERFLYLPAAAFTIAVTAAAWQIPSRKAATGFLAALLVLYAGRTMARNLDWNNDLTLAEADVRSAPQSARLHDTLAKSLFDQDDRRNIDRAIREQEIACSIIRPVPPEQSSELLPAHLGIYYFSKAGFAGAPQTEAARAWYGKAVTALSEARTIALAREQVFDREQAAHGKPQAPRNTFHLLFAYLGYSYLNLGQYAEALESFRAGRIRDPRMPEFYDGMAAAYLRAGNAGMAAVVLLEKAQVTSPGPAEMRALGELYSRLPDGSCAVHSQGGVQQLNPGCPKLRADLCRASADLSRGYTEARLPGQAQAVKDTAMRSFACDAAALSAPPSLPGL